MNRRAFTLLEVLLSISLATVVVVSSTTWLLALERAAKRSASHELAFRAALMTASRLRDDLMSTMELPGPDGGSFNLWVEGLGGGVRREVRWRHEDGRVIRSEGASPGHQATTEIIATGIEEVSCPDDGRGFRRVRVVAGGQVIDLPLRARGHHGP